MLNEASINEIRSNADIVEIISDYIPLVNKGRNLFGVCPFHDDHSPSMSVSKSKQIYKCFSCGAGGNVFNFVSAYENVSYIEAIKIVAEKIGYEIKGIIKSDIKKNKQEYEAMDIALKYYQNNLNTSAGTLAKKYLSDERHLSDECIREFQIGYANNNNLNVLLNKKGYENTLLNNIGLINISAERSYDTFTNRIMFPIHNLDGQAIGFTGRIFGGEDTNKYLNSRENKIFKKGDILFNYHRAIKYIREKKQVIVVEGNMDAIRLYSSGIKNVIAIMGTAITDYQVELIKKLRSEIILFFDNDNAGLDATFNIGNIFENKDVKTSIVRISGKKDADEYILEYGIEKMVECINNKVPFLDFKLKYLKKDLNISDAGELTKYLKSVLESVQNIDDELLKEVTLKKISKEYEIDIGVLKKELSKFELVRKEKVKEEKRISQKENVYLNVFYYMLNDSKYIKAYIKNIGFISVQKYRELASEIINYYETNHTINIADFITYINKEEELAKIINDVLDNIDVELNDDIFMNYVSNIKKIDTKNTINKLKNELKEELDENKRLAIVMKIANLKKGEVEDGRN